MLRLIRTIGVRAFSQPGQLGGDGSPTQLAPLSCSCLVLIVNYDVVARGLFNEPFRGSI